MKTIKTVIHPYKFDTSKPEEARQHQELLERLGKDEGRGSWMHVLAGGGFGGGHELPIDKPTEIELETSFLYNNQWNTAPFTGSEQGWRVFDWYEGIYDNPSYKKGHWLEITDEMRAIRRETLHCSYCGKHYPKGGEEERITTPTGRVFCASCLDSPYLKEKDFPLLALTPIDAHYRGKFPELTPEERAVLLPVYVKRQTEGNESRMVQARIKARAQAEEKYTKGIAALETEHTAMLWLLDRNINVEDCIYYDHIHEFSFGWRGSGLDLSVAEELQRKLEGFPGTYAIQVTGGGVLGSTNKQKGKGGRA